MLDIPPDLAVSTTCFIATPEIWSWQTASFLPMHCQHFDLPMIRLDQALVERGLCDSRERAKRAILAGRVRVNGQPARKPGDAVKPDDVLALEAGEKYVSRAGHKLEHALDHFQLGVTGLVAIDLGASTGGFTDCLLQRGAARVFAVDVGKGQLAWKLRNDLRVVVMEKTNARFLTCKDFAAHTTVTPSPLKGERAGVRGEDDTGISTKPAGRKQAYPSSSIPLPVEGRGKAQRTDAEISTGTVKAEVNAEPPADIVVIDCSFISLRKILPAAGRLLKAGGKIVALIKPQFEAGKAEADRGRGVITDAAIHDRVLRELREFVSTQAGPVRYGGGSLEASRGALSHGAGLCWRNVVESPLLGPAGNKEFLVLIEKTCAD
jgi:predicted rRNA methylase YqxC with S4 and FtsJ domains